MRAKPKTCAGAARERRLWRLYTIAFATLVNRHICLPSQFYDTDGDCERESALDLSRAAMTLAIAADARMAGFREAEPLITGERNGAKDVP